jgi:hypothetical protein
VPLDQIELHGIDNLLDLTPLNQGTTIITKGDLSKTEEPNKKEMTNTLQYFLSLNPLE